VIALGVLLLLLGFILPLPLIFDIGAVLLVIGLVLYFLGASGRSIGGRKYWY
jgi:hypothetical protein